MQTNRRTRESCVRGRTGSSFLLPEQMEVPMTFFSRGLFIFAGVLCTLFLCSPVRAEAPAVNAGQVTLLNVTSDCLPCVLQDKIVHKVEKEFSDRVRFIYIDVEKEPAVKEKFAVKAIPTLIFFDRDAREVKRNFGYMKESAIKDCLTLLLKDK